MSSLECVENEGRLALVGQMSFASVADLLSDRRDWLSGSGELVVDLIGLEKSDSAGIALMIDWTRRMKSQGRQIRFENVPPQILAMARVSGLDEILPLDGNGVS